MNRELKINSYLNRGIVEANLNFAKENRSCFSLVKFGFSMDEDDAFTFKDLISFIHTYTDFSPILYLGNDTFLLFLRDTKIYQAKAIINKLNHQIGNRFDFEIKDIGITINYQEDRYKNLMDRIDKYYIMSKLSSSKKIFYGTVDFDYYDSMDLFKIFKNIFAKSNKISLNNIYKGIPLSEKVTIIGFTEGVMQVKIKAEKLPFYQKEKFTFLQHDSIPDIIKASILKIDTNKQLLVLGNLELIDNSPIARADIRVEPKQKIHALIIKENKKIAEGTILSISEGSISLNSTPNQIRDILNQNIFHKELEIKFQLPNSKNFLSPIKIKAYIFSIIDNRIIVTISPTTIERTRIRDYISKQQNELLMALKRELNK